MNQNDQIQHDEERLEQLYWEFDQARKQSGEERWHFKGFMRGYAAHVKETPKNEHDSDDVLKPAKLVRLKMQEVREVLGSIANDNNNSDLIDCYDFANAIMDAMIKKNGG